MMPQKRCSESQIVTSVVMPEAAFSRPSTFSTEKWLSCTSQGCARGSFSQMFPRFEPILAWLLHCRDLRRTGYLWINESHHQWSDPHWLKRLKCNARLIFFELVIIGDPSRELVEPESWTSRRLPGQIT